MAALTEKKVLLIEDDQTMRNLLVRLLEIEGFQIFAMRSPSGQQIIEAVNTHQPFAMILDVRLEGQNGLDLLKSIRANPTTAALGVMMTSGEDLRDQCLELGADGFLLKPYTPTDLIAWLREQFQHYQNKEC